MDKNKNEVSTKGTSSQNKSGSNNSSKNVESYITAVDNPKSLKTSDFNPDERPRRDGPGGE